MHHNLHRLRDAFTNFSISGSGTAAICPHSFAHAYRARVGHENVARRKFVGNLLIYLALPRGLEKPGTFCAAIGISYSNRRAEVRSMHAKYPRRVTRVLSVD